MTASRMPARLGSLLLIACFVTACGSVGVGGSTASNPAPTEAASNDGSAATPTAAPTEPNADGVMPADPAALNVAIPTFDPEALTPSGGAAAVGALAALQPDVASLQADIQAAERAALTSALASLPIKPTGSVGNVRSSGVLLAIAKLSTAADGAGVPPAAKAATTADGAVFMIGLVSGLSDMWTPDVPPGAGVSGSGKETFGDAQATLSLDLGRSKDGSTNFGIGIQSDASKGGVTATSDTAASIRGLRCPDANGQVNFTAKVRLGADSGANGRTEDLTANVTATVGDDATYGQTQIDIVQGTRQASGGRQVYVESGMTIRFTGTDYSTAASSNAHLIRSSQQATIADVSEFSETGHTAALKMGVVALHLAQNNWRSGGCVKIVATSPGQVAPSSATPIPVSVVGRFDNADVPSKLDAVLTGGASLDPTTIPKTPGTLSYAAPGERDKSATIALTATSKRGIATLTLTASTGGGAAYHFTGGLQDFKVDQDVCDITAPFTLDGKIGTAKYSGGLTGTYVANGGFGAHYDGEYAITLPNGLGQPGTMSGHIVGTTAGVAGSGTDHYTLTPLATCG